MTRKIKPALTLAIWLSTMAMNAQTTTVHGRVEVIRAASGAQKKNAAAKATNEIPATVVWLTPAPESGVKLDAPAPSATNPQLVQKNKSFAPHLLVIPAGSMVEFPNRDPFFHNVFSLFEGKRFDLGLYEAGTTRAVRFDRPGISYIFCNIHPQMSAVVITMSTPLYAIASKDGQVSIASVPYGRYTLHVWSEGMGPENETAATREVTVGESATALGVIGVRGVNGEHVAHKNKYGREYDEPTPDSLVYEQQH